MKKMFFSYFFLIFFLFSGCDFVPFVGPVVSGVIAWKDGEAHKFYHEEISTLYASVKVALRELNYDITSDQIQKNGDYYLLAGQKDEFKIYIRKVEPRITEVRIRVNFMGNKPYAELIYQHIDKNLNVVEFDRNGDLTNFSEN